MPVHSIEIELVNPLKENAITVHRFTLGLGNCGREVIQLEAFTEGPVLEIEQTCADNPTDPDYFGYPWHRVLRYKVYYTDNPCPAKSKQ